MEDRAAYLQRIEERVKGLEDYLQTLSAREKELVKSINAKGDLLNNLEIDYAKDEKIYSKQTMDLIAAYNREVEEERARFKKESKSLENDKEFITKEQSRLAAFEARLKDLKKSLDDRAQYLSEVADDLSEKEILFDVVSQELQEDSNDIAKEKELIKNRSERTVKALQLAEKKLKDTEEEREEFLTWQSHEKSLLLSQEKNIQKQKEVLDARIKQARDAEEKAQAEMRTLIHARNALHRQPQQ